ncbi:DUF3135 domain-containing protein [Variovorax sp. M-6]
MGRPCRRPGLSACDPVAVSHHNTRHSSEVTSLSSAMQHRLRCQRADVDAKRSTCRSPRGRDVACEHRS